MNWRIVKVKDRTYDIVSDDDGFDEVLMTISDENIELILNMPETGNQVAIGDCMDAEKAFWEYWNKRWPGVSNDENKLKLSANFRETKAAFLAGWESNDNLKEVKNENNR